MAYHYVDVLECYVCSHEGMSKQLEPGQVGECKSCFSSVICCNRKFKNNGEPLKKCKEIAKLDDVSCDYVCSHCIELDKSYRGVYWEEHIEQMKKISKYNEKKSMDEVKNENDNDILSMGKHNIYDGYFSDDGFVVPDDDEIEYEKPKKNKRKRKTTFNDDNEIIIARSNNKKKRKKIIVDSSDEE